MVRGVECVLTNLTVADSGYYTCVARNHIGEDYASMYLSVIPRPIQNKPYFEFSQDNWYGRDVYMFIFGVLFCVLLMALIYFGRSIIMKRRQRERVEEPTTLPLNNSDG